MDKPGLDSNIDKFQVLELVSAIERPTPASTWECYRILVPLISLKEILPKSQFATGRYSFAT